MKLRIVPGGDSGYNNYTKERRKNVINIETIREYFRSDTIGNYTAC